MKNIIKGKLGFSLRNTAVIGLVLYVVLVAVRMYHTFFLIDGDTGFFVKKDITVSLMYILAIAGVPLILVLCYISHDCTRGKVIKTGSFMSAASGILLSLTMAVYGISETGELIRSIPSVVAEAEKISWINVLCIVFSFLGALVILVESVLSALGKEIPSVMKLPMLFPVLWAFFRTLSFFSVTVSYVKVSQLLFTIFASAFLMLFLFENARIVSDIGKKDALWLFFATGIITAGLSFAAGLPYFFAAIFASEKIVSHCPFELYTIPAGIYALCCIYKRSGREITDGENSESVAETE